MCPVFNGIEFNGGSVSCIDAKNIVDIKISKKTTLIYNMILAGWQSGHAAACKAVYAGSIPASASTFIAKINVNHH